MPTQKYPSANKLLDHVIAVNERHLKRLFSERVRYYHEDRTDHRLRKGTPTTEFAPESWGRALSEDRLGGLHHRVTFGLPDPDQLFTYPYIYVSRMCPCPSREESLRSSTQLLTESRRSFQSTEQEEPHHFLRGLGFGETQVRQFDCSL